MKPSEMLRAGAKVLSGPERFTTEWYARDAQGIGVDVLSPRATCFCSVGAIERGMHEAGEERVHTAFGDAYRTIEEGYKLALEARGIDRRPFTATYAYEYEYDVVEYEYDAGTPTHKEEFVVARFSDASGFEVAREVMLEAAAILEGRGE